MDKEISNRLSGAGITIELAGDHQIHTILVRDGYDQTFQWDDTSRVLTIHLDEVQAKELYWDLLDIIPKLRHDRR